MVGSAYAAAVQSEMIDTSLTGEVRGAGVGKVFAWTVNERRVVCSWGRTWCLHVVYGMDRVKVMEGMEGVTHTSRSPRFYHS